MSLHPAHQPVCKYQEKEVMPNSTAESQSEVEVLTICNVSSNISYISNISTESPINLNNIGVCKYKQMCSNIVLYMVQESSGVDIVSKFSDEPPSQVNIVRGDENSFFGGMPYLLASIEELYAYIGLNIVMFFKSYWDTYTKCSGLP